MENHFRIVYIGGPTAILEIGGFRFMTDPTLDPSGGVYYEFITKQRAQHLLTLA
jgi:L-ascorbate metabolism protein UlaG (beta-lactamase superfamily)